MNYEHLGDAFDHWKGSIIYRLKRNDLLRNITIVPMINDPDHWGANEIKAYYQLLCMEEDLAPPYDDKTFKHTKEDLFGNVDYPGDLFLDPDTGINYSENTRTPKHVDLPDIRKLLEQGKETKRLVLIYQHGDRVGSLEDKLKRIIERAQEEIPNLHALTYNCGQVAMLFFSTDEGRVGEIETYLKKMLYGDSRKQVKIWLKKQ